MGAAVEHLATYLALAFCVALAVFAGWRGAHPFDPRRGPRMVPWRLVMLLSVAAGILCLVHLANAFGIHTGR